jgi:MYXO-CTERM domain-containing protein
LPTAPAQVPLINSPTSASGVAAIGLLLLALIASMRRNRTREEI